ncbi:MAG: RdgB/HAM1 family non-canonical purine NTP pyrophosphatase [Chloroflexota bacterium]|nr:RdgB/HAM1 family non-canonical purine NTP pyrophosphatase [Chloroflexota bacterium]
MSRRLLLATRARHKVAELHELLDLTDVTLVTPDEVGIEGEPVEDAETFEGNAAIKAHYYAERSGLPTLADDSGLEVDALDGRPGIYTRRYAGDDPTDGENNTKLLGELDGLPPERRGARYQCVLAFIDPVVGREPVFRAGAFEGRIATGPRGDGGFGYDPIFEPESEAPGARTVGQMSADEKHALSHRGKAARAMAEYLKGEGW